MYVQTDADESASVLFEYCIVNVRNDVVEKRRLPSVPNQFKRENATSKFLSTHDVFAEHRSIGMKS